MTTKRYASRDSMLLDDDRTLEEVQLPEWGGIVRLRPMSGAERDEFEREALKRAAESDGDPTGLKARAIVYSVVDEDGSRVFTFADLPLIQARSTAAIEKLWAHIQRVSLLNDAEVRKALRSAAGNSGGAPSADFGSSSPHASE